MDNLENCGTNTAQPTSEPSNLTANNVTKPIGNGFESLQVAQQAVQASAPSGHPPCDGQLQITAPSAPQQPSSGESYRWWGKPPTCLSEEKYVWPPGFAGQLATFIYYSSYLPVREVAIAGALGLLAGVCGRAFTISGKSVSMYIILVARSGIGKDGMHEGIHKLIELAEMPVAKRFVRAEDFASGPALHKAILTGPGFLNLQGEFGRKMKRMANPTDAPMQALRTVMTNAYGKKYLDGISYSDPEKSLIGVQNPALSFLGETTPTTFHESLTPDMLADGFMSRFLTFTHNGDRPLSNELRSFELEPEELVKWRAILARALPYQDTICMPPPIQVKYASEEIRDKLCRFEFECGDAINAAGDDEPLRQIYNRAHLKALQIASLLAIADNEVFPKISLAHATWAITTVRKDIEVFIESLRSGNIGSSDHTREAKLKSIIRKYFSAQPKPSYKIPVAMWQNGIIPRKYFQQNVSSASVFNTHKLGAIVALDITLRSLVDNGYLQEVDKSKIVEAYKVFGKCYRIVAEPE